LPCAHCGKYHGEEREERQHVIRRKREERESTLRWGKTANEQKAGARDRKGGGREDPFIATFLGGSCSVRRKKKRETSIPAPLQRGKESKLAFGHSDLQAIS